MVEGLVTRVCVRVYIVCVVLYVCVCVCVCVRVRACVCGESDRRQHTYGADGVRSSANTTARPMHATNSLVTQRHIIDSSPHVQGPSCCKFEEPQYVFACTQSHPPHPPTCVQTIPHQWVCPRTRHNYDMQVWTYTGRRNQPRTTTTQKPTARTQPTPRAPPRKGKFALPRVSKSVRTLAKKIPRKNSAFARREKLLWGWEHPENSRDTLAAFLGGRRTPSLSQVLELQSANHINEGNNVTAD
jgi:hypothetical protein